MLAVCLQVCALRQENPGSWNRCLCDIRRLSRLILSFRLFFYMRYQRPTRRIEDIVATTVTVVDQALAESGIRAGHTVAVAVGSRGIANLAGMVRILCQRLRRVGAIPFIVPAMGSHGGATAQGQTAILDHLGISETSCGAPLRASMDADQIATVFDRVPVFCGRDISGADHAVCINRIKPHTKFKGPLESGLAKMLCVGMGKHEGARAFHHWSLQYGFFEVLEKMAETFLAHSNFRFGLAVVENGRDETFHIEAVPADRMLEREPLLLEMAKAQFPRLPIRQVDVLAIETIGKDISGAGMDPNVTGRAFDLMESDFAGLMMATRVAILNLSRRTVGNAIGLGNADIITEKVFQAMDYEATLMNALTSLSLHKAFIPVRLPTDRKALQACFTTLGPTAANEVKAVIIRDTLHVNDFMASAALMESLSGDAAAEILSGPFELDFNAAGDVLTPWSSSG